MLANIIKTCMMEWFYLVVIAIVRMTFAMLLIKEWDDDLAYIAQFWAANCHYSLNKYRSHQSSEFDYVGETIANTTNSYVNYTHLVYEWFQKGKRYNYYQGYCRSSDGTVDTYGHGCIPYRQVS